VIWAIGNEELINMEKKGQFYDPGQWGYYRNCLKGKVMDGFLQDPHQVIDNIVGCEEYEIVFVASLTYSDNQQNAEWHLRRPASGSLLIVNSAPIMQFFPGTFFCKTMIGVITDSSYRNSKIDTYFGDGYNIYGTGQDAKTSNGNNCCSNCVLIKTLRNNNHGRLYVVSERKAFPRINKESRWMNCDQTNQTIYESQEHETLEAERICNVRHYSFLCRKLGFSCAVASLITRFALEDTPFFFAEPGDIWIDIKLSTPVRTYVLARKRQNYNVQSTFIKQFNSAQQLKYLILGPGESKLRLRQFSGTPSSSANRRDITPSHSQDGNSSIVAAPNNDETATRNSSSRRNRNIEGRNGRRRGRGRGGNAGRHSRRTNGSDT